MFRIWDVFCYPLVKSSGVGVCIGRDVWGIEEGVPSGVDAWVVKESKKGSESCEEYFEEDSAFLRNWRALGSMAIA